MPYFNANPGPSIAASIASRVGRARAAREAARDKAAGEQKYKFTYKPRAEEFVFYYPRAPSFEAQIEREERSANHAIMQDAVRYATAAATAAAPTSPVSERQQHVPPATLASPSAPRAATSAADGGGNADDAARLLAQPQAVAPFAVDSGRGTVHRSQPQQGGGTQHAKTEYRREYSPSRGGGGAVARVPVDRGVELILQRGGMSDLRSKAAASAAATASSQRPTAWDPRPRRHQPEVVLSMQPQRQQPAKGVVARTVYAARPRSAPDDIAPQPRVLQSRPRPASAGAPAAHHSIPSNAPQTSTGARAASPAVRRSQSVATCGSARFHANCAAPAHRGAGAVQPPVKSAAARRGPPQNYLNRRQLAQQQRRASADELPSTHKFVPVPRAEPQEQQPPAPEQAPQHGCGCPCHAMVEHERRVQANRATPCQRRQLAGAPNYQTQAASTRTGVGACLEWPVDAAGTKLN